MKKSTYEWNLEKPLVIFDLETTGINIKTDRIVELAAIRISPDNRRETHVFRVDPTIPIPSEATAIHGIGDSDVVGCPTFVQLSSEIAALFEGADVGGFNVLRFDIPLLVEEFMRAGIRFDLESRSVVDAQRIFHRKEPRDLSAALSFYCNEMHLGAHGAEADATATLRVLESQLIRYGDLPRDVKGLSDYCDIRKPEWVDRTGRLKWQNGDIVINFGKKKGVTLKHLIDKEPSFIKWMLGSDFPADTQALICSALDGNWPRPPDSSGPGQAD